MRDVDDADDDADEDDLDPAGALPEDRFLALWRALGAQGHAYDALGKLRAAYGEPHRAYHTARHVRACLDLLAEPAVAALATHLPEVEAAIWFHDAIYDTHASDNEERSAAMAAKILGAAGVPREAIARVADHIRATHHHAATTSDASLVVDVDLSILGSDAETFARFEEEIRREYAWVPPEPFAAGRAAVLRAFAEREQIYATPLFRDRLEVRARANLTRRLAELSA